MTNFLSIKEVSAKRELTEWMPQARREAIEAEAVAPTKSEATAKALSGIIRHSPAKPLL